MHTFTDNAGNVWSIVVNVTAIKRVRGLLGIDLYALVDDGCKPLGKLVSDPVQLCDVLYVLCKDEADSRKITDEDFGRALYGDVLGQAADALISELFCFFPEERTRESLKKVVQASRKVRDHLLDHVTTQIDQIDPSQIAKHLIASYGNSRASSASIPAPSPSANS